MKILLALVLVVALLVTGCGSETIASPSSSEVPRSDQSSEKIFPIVFVTILEENTIELLISAGSSVIPQNLVFVDRDGNISRYPLVWIDGGGTVYVGHLKVPDEIKQISFQNDFGEFEFQGEQHASTWQLMNSNTLERP
ncbi:MAG: hypothetical protein E6Q58_05035 [Niabella sp.]|nr:MAG: hypothetical protein E6Q58_05035 [Niabella sp.]